MYCVYVCFGVEVLLQWSSHYVLTPSTSNSCLFIIVVNLIKFEKEGYEILCAKYITFMQIQLF